MTEWVCDLCRQRFSDRALLAGHDCHPNVYTAVELALSDPAVLFGVRGNSVTLPYRRSVIDGNIIRSPTPLEEIIATALDGNIQSALAVVIALERHGYKIEQTRFEIKDCIVKRPDETDDEFLARGVEGRNE